MIGEEDAKELHSLQEGWKEGQHCGMTHRDQQVSLSLLPTGNGLVPPFPMET